MILIIILLKLLKLLHIFDVLVHMEHCYRFKFDLILGSKLPCDVEQYNNISNIV